MGGCSVLFLRSRFGPGCDRKRRIGGCLVLMPAAYPAQAQTPPRVLLRTLARRRSPHQSIIADRVRKIVLNSSVVCLSNAFVRPGGARPRGAHSSHRRTDGDIAVTRGFEQTILLRDPLVLLI